MPYKIDGENLIFVDGETGREANLGRETTETVRELTAADTTVGLLPCKVEQKKFPEQCLMCGNKNIVAWFTCKACGIEWRIAALKKENPCEP